MRLANEAKSYATQANAIKKLAQVFGADFETRADLRWMISVNSAGRFVPVVVGIQWAGVAHAGVAVVG
jgi:hypothetical protein